jgi:hypothetical protein
MKGRGREGWVGCSETSPLQPRDMVGLDWAQPFPPVRAANHEIP